MLNLKWHCKEKINHNNNHNKRQKFKSKMNNQNH